MGTRAPRRDILFPALLEDTAHAPLSRAMVRRGFTHSALFTYWPRAVGDAEMARHCMPVSCVKSGKDGAQHILYVRVHPAYKALFAHQADMILARLTTLLGYPPAKRIKIR